jgi:transposase
MQSTEFYRSLLQLSSDWSVSKIETDHASQSIHVHLAYVGERAPSPVTGELCPIYDYREARQWRHLDTMQYRTYLHARVPRVRLPGGEIVTIRVPWADAQSHHTLLFEAMAIAWLQASKNQTQAARQLRISFDQMHRIMRRAVVRGQVRRRAQREQEAPVRYLSIDEKRYKRGHQYLTVVSNAETGQVLAVRDGRTTDAALRAIAEAVPPHQRADVNAVAMDMAPLFRYPVRTLLPAAQIVHDKFHLFQYLTQAIDVTRRMEAGVQPVLRKTRMLWLKNTDHRSATEDRRFEQINAMNLRTAQAWRVRENFRSMYSECNGVDEAITYFTKWKDHAVSTMLRPVQRVVRLFDKHVHGIVNYFRHPISNARAEQLNSKLALLNRFAKGFRSAENMTTSILFFYGNLQLLPQETL